MAYIPFLVMASSDEVPVGGVLPDSVMNGLTGPAKNLSDFRGKPLLINVWASYCGPCLSEMGSIERLHQKYNEDFTIIGISIDDYITRANRFLAKTDTSFIHYIDQKLVLEKMLGVTSIPFTVLVDAQGRILTKVSGARQWDSAEIIEAIGKTFDIEMP